MQFETASSFFDSKLNKYTPPLITTHAPLSKRIKTETEPLVVVVSLDDTEPLIVGAALPPPPSPPPSPPSDAVMFPPPPEGMNEYEKWVYLNIQRNKKEMIRLGVLELVAGMQSSPGGSGSAPAKPQQKPKRKRSARAAANPAAVGCYRDVDVVQDAFSDDDF